MSEAQTVEGHADACERTRTLKFPTFPKFAPSTDTTVAPEETAKERVHDEIAGVIWLAFAVSGARALNATLNLNCEILPLSEGKRHVTIVSLVQNEPVQAVAIDQADGDDAIFAKDTPARTACELPVVGIDSADVFVATGSG